MQDGRGSVLSSIETREFEDGGDKMVLTHTLPTKQGIKSVRVYKRMD